MTQATDGSQAAAAIYRKDYQGPPFWIDTVDLTFDLDPAKTRVLNKMRLRRNPDVVAQALRLDGEDLNLARVLVNGGGTSFKMDGAHLGVRRNPPRLGEHTDELLREVGYSSAQIDAMQAAQKVRSLS